MTQELLEYMLQQMYNITKVDAKYMEQKENYNYKNNIFYISLNRK